MGYWLNLVVISKVIQVKMGYPNQVELSSVRAALAHACINLSGLLQDLHCRQEMQCFLTCICSSSKAKRRLCSASISSRSEIISVRTVHTAQLQVGCSTSPLSDRSGDETSVSVSSGGKSDILQSESTSTIGKCGVAGYGKRILQYTKCIVTFNRLPFTVLWNHSSCILLLLA